MKKQLGVWQAVAVASQIGVAFAAAVAVGLFVGWYLDSLLHVSPLFTILGALAGAVSGVFSCIQIARYAMRDQ